MTLGSWILVSMLLSSFVPGLLILILREEGFRIRTALNMGGATIKLVLVVGLIWGIWNGHIYEARLAFLPDVDLVLRADALSVLFSSLSAGLWFVTTVYAIGYLEGSPHRRRFFGFFSFTVTTTVGISLAGNLITFLLFYELLTLTTYPLVVHRQTDQALRAGRIYLAYTVAGGAVLFVGVAWLSVLAGPLEFTSGGVGATLGNVGSGSLRTIFALLIGGLAVKAVLFPLHGWLPVAMIAPTPVSALLHAVAVVKAGAFGIFRVLNDVYGIELAGELGVTLPLAFLAAFTIVYGSIRALFQEDLKLRLAYSTVSQISYITLGIALAGPIAGVAALVHLVHQGLMKITLFLCAGNLAETLGIHRVSEMKGVAYRMPWTMVAFTVGGLGMIGVPPLAGFISKWHLGLGGLEVGQEWVVAVLIISSALNAAYFLPVVYTAWFQQKEGSWPREVPRGGLETSWLLLVPSLATAIAVMGVGILANSPLSPLGWAKLIMLPGE